MHFPWNGNIRQLRNIIERVMIFTDDNEIRPELLPNELFKRHTKTDSTILIETEIPKEDEKSQIIHALEKTYGNKSASAKMLGFSRVTLYNKMKKYGLL
jgi:transcriptional regulator of acetoin/glycerol metabolism